ncbi:hypothetical protein CKK33_06445 [Mucilaginibacter sp. MD40]|nr:hypothetical protein CKK33_06445 [Mucilaginibacter sp. MD40]
MELTNLSSLISLFSAFNFAYAGSREFRSIIDNEISKLEVNVRPVITRKIGLIKSSEFVLKIEGKYDFSNIYNQHYQALLNNIEQIRARSQNAFNFTLGYRSIFLNSFYFSLILLVLSGYQSSVDIRTFNTAIWVLNFGFIYNLVVFIRGFTKASDKPIHPAYPSILFLISAIVLSLIFYKGWSYDHVPSIEMNLGISLFIVVSPYLMHFSRLFIFVIFYRLLMSIAHYRCMRQLDKIDSAVKVLKSKR